VRDEGKDIVGTQAIRAWKIETGAKYRITAEPLESRPEASRTIVVVKVSGTFPGSPANLAYRFGFSADGRVNEQPSRTCRTACTVTSGTRASERLLRRGCTNSARGSSTPPTAVIAKPLSVADTYQRQLIQFGQNIPEVRFGCLLTEA
jgi:hypothetical protein